MHWAQCQLEKPSALAIEPKLSPILGVEGRTPIIPKGPECVLLRRDMEFVNGCGHFPKSGVLSELELGHNRRPEIRSKRLLPSSPAEINFMSLAAVGDRMSRGLPSIVTFGIVFVTFFKCHPCLHHGG